MKTILILIGGLSGLVTGLVVGFAVALLISTPRYDGTYGMREMLICLPLGALAGLVAGVTWGATRG